ncbi:MAG: hypothetical protein ACRDOU_10830 [Streptosporangiaceae bacterium]
MVPGDFIGYFAAAGTAAGTLIGLLFVAVSLRPESVLGATAPPAARAVAGSAFIALVNSFFVSLVAVIPNTSLGYVAAIMAVASLWSTLRLHRALTGSRSALRQLLLAAATYCGQLGVGVALIIRPDTRELVSVVGYLLVSSFAVGLTRAWSLMQGQYAGAKQEQPPTQAT